MPVPMVSVLEKVDCIAWLYKKICLLCSRLHSSLHIDYQLLKKWADNTKEMINGNFTVTQA